MPLCTNHEIKRGKSNVFTCKLYMCYCTSHADWLLTVIIVPWTYEDYFSFVTSALSKGSSHTQLGAMPSRPCSPTFIMLTLQSLVLQHQKRTNKTAETEPRYNALTYKNNRNYGTTWNHTPQKTHGGWVGGEGQAMAEGNKNNWTLKRNMTWRPLAHLNTYSQLCVRKTFSASFIPQPTEKHNFSFKKQ